jgi:hypothetical protein
MTVMDTKFKIGNAGGPGRPSGTGDGIKAARKLLNPHVPQLVEQRLAAALKGDGQAADTLLHFFAETTHT